MPDNRDQQKNTSKTPNDKSKPAGANRQKIGTGMDSLDSTQAPLKAETGEPDYEAMTGKGKDKKTK